MIQVLSWILIGSSVVFGLSFLLFSVSRVTGWFIMGIAVAAGVSSAILMVILLIKERLKDREAEKDDLGKY